MSHHVQNDDHQRNSETPRIWAICAARCEDVEGRPAGGRGRGRGRGRDGDGDGAVTDVGSNSGGIRFPDMGGGDWICSLSFLGNYA